MVWKQDLWFIPKLTQTFIQLMFPLRPPQKLYNLLKNGANICLENLPDLHLPLLTSLTHHRKNF